MLQMKQSSVPFNLNRLILILKWPLLFSKKNFSKLYYIKMHLVSSPLMFYLVTDLPSPASLSFSMPPSRKLFLGNILRNISSSSSSWEGYTLGMSTVEYQNPLLNWNTNRSILYELLHVIIKFLFETGFRKQQYVIVEIKQLVVERIWIIR